MFVSSVFMWPDLIKADWLIFNQREFFTKIAFSTTKYQGNVPRFWALTGIQESSLEIYYGICHQGAMWKMVIYNKIIASIPEKIDIFLI